MNVRQEVANMKHYGVPMTTAARILLILLIMAAAGCGRDNNSVTSDCLAPFGSTITLDPPAPILKGGGLDLWQDFQVVVTYPDGDPMPKACINITGTFATGAIPAYTFYYYPKAHAGNTAVPSGFDAQTNNSGSYTFSILISSATGSFKDDIVVKSGANSGQAPIEFTQ